MLSSGTLAGAGFCLLATAGIVVGSVTAYRRGDSDSTTAGLLLMAVVCVLLLSFAVALLSPRLEGRALWALELSSIALLLGLGLALVFLTDEFISDQSSGVRTPTTTSGGRITGAILLVMGLLRAGMATRRRS